LEVTRMLFAGAVFFAASQTFSQTRSRRGLLAVWSVFGALIAVYSLLQTRGGLGPLLVPHFERPLGTFGNPIFLAAYLLVSAIIASGVAAASTHGKRGFYSTCAALCVLALFSTQTRGAFAGVGAAAIVWALLLLKGRWRWTALGALGLVGVLAVLLFRSRAWTHGLIWRDTLAMWLDHPWLGVGLGRFHIEFPAYASDELKSLWPQRRVIVNFAHNEYLQVLSETGAIGLSILCAVAVSAAAWLKRVWSNATPGEERLQAGVLAFSATAVLAQNFFSPDIRFGVSTFVVFFCLGAAAGILSDQTSDFPPFPGRLGVAAIAAAGLMVWGRLAVRPLIAQRRLSAEPEFHTASTEAEQKIAKLETSLGASPGNADAAENLAYLYAKKKDWAKAVEYFSMTARLRPERPGPFNNLGNIHYMLGDVESAIRFWKMSLERSDGQLDAHLNLGKALYETGRLKASAEHLHIVLAQDPDNEKAQILLKKMIE